LTGEAVPLFQFGSAAIFGLITLGALLVYLVCFGLQQGWNYTIGYALRWLAGQIRGVSISVYFWSFHPLDFLADGFEWIANEIDHWLGVAALNAEHAATAMWHLTAQVFWWSVHETKALAVDTFHALEHAIVVTVPDAAKWARREAVTVAHRLVNIEAAARRAVDRRLDQLAHVAEADALHGIRTAEHALDWSEAEVGSLWRDLGGLKARLERIEKALDPAAIVALIGATIFTKFGLGWLRCNNVGRMGRALCGLPLGLLDDLLALAIVPLIATDICDFADTIESLAQDFQPALMGLVDAEDALVGCHGATAPPVLTLPVLHLPPTNLGLPLAA
jgi:hypothetical protein